MKNSSSKLQKRKPSSRNNYVTALLLVLSVAILATSLAFIYYKSKITSAERITEDFVQIISIGAISQKQIIFAVICQSLLIIGVISASCVIKKVPQPIWCIGVIICPLLILCMSSLIYYVYKFEYETSGLREQMMDTFTQLKKNQAARTKWRSLENELQCCGINGPTDYLDQGKKESSKLNKFFGIMKKSAKIATAIGTGNVIQLYKELKVYKDIPSSCYSGKLISSVGSNGCLEMVKVKISQHNKKWLQYFLIILGLSLVLIITAMFSFK